MNATVLLLAHTNEKCVIATVKALKAQTAGSLEIILFEDGVDPDRRRIQGVDARTIDDPGAPTDWKIWNEMIQVGKEKIERGKPVLFCDDTMYMRPRLMEELGGRIQRMGEIPPTISLVPNGMGTPVRAPYTSLRRKPHPYGFTRSGWTRLPTFLAGTGFFAALYGIEQPPPRMAVEPENYVEQQISLALRDRAQLYEETPLIRPLEASDLPDLETSRDQAREKGDEDQEASD